MGDQLDPENPHRRSYLCRYRSLFPVGRYPSAICKCHRPDPRLHPLDPLGAGGKKVVGEIYP